MGKAEYLHPFEVLMLLNKLDDLYISITPINALRTHICVHQTHFLQTILDLSTLQTRIQRLPRKGYANQSHLYNILGFIVVYETNNKCEYIAHMWHSIEHDARFFPAKLPLQLLFIQRKQLGHVVTLQIG
jgi:hypothetical protein